ncbi:glycosyltransferase family 25 protein [Haemophilus parahaemolyticus]|uniref:glycosyltransferase family 25 protein n=1 Tax=Haemophilus parahaemolyticus TaxID=735 RepID=UPI00290A6A5C|nr:glycosyltransferase family 25 protein [Haemophilus parahaemolyticus]MDU4464595.1 glycosyltransferase family 25 protein [Haemophilus parahaemolyticus]
MKKVIHYVLYSEQQAAQLKDKPCFIPILTINATQIDASDTALIFNTQRAFEKLNRPITNREIAHTLSHIKCWKAIAENSELDDEDFALIAECSVNLVGNFQQLAQDYAYKAMLVEDYFKMVIMLMLLSMEILANIIKAVLYTLFVRILLKN